MTLRPFSLPGSISLLCAFVFLVIVTISLPSFSAMDFVRTHFGSQLKLDDDGGVDDVRFGIWSACYDVDGHRICAKKGHGYTVFIFTSTGQIATIGSSWTRGLAIHPVAAIVTFIALLASFTTNVLAILVSNFLAAFLTLIAFACDIALLAFARKKFGELDDAQADTSTGPAFWLTFVSFVLLCVAGGMFLFGRRRERGDDDGSYALTDKSFWKRLRRIY